MKEKTERRENFGKEQRGEKGEFPKVATTTNSKY